jgi:hypothetical protein
MIIRIVFHLSSFLSIAIGNLKSFGEGSSSLYCARRPRRQIAKPSDCQ